MDAFGALTRSVQLALVATVAVVLFLAWDLFQHARNIDKGPRPPKGFLQDCVDVILNTALFIGLWIALQSVNNLPFIVGFIVLGVIVLIAISVPAQIAASGKTRPSITRKSFLSSLAWSTVWIAALLYLAADIWKTYAVS